MEDLKRGLGIPDDPNFGMPPEEVPHDWEFAQGQDTFARVSKVGRSNIDFLSRMEGDVADAGDDAKWEVVRAIGEESLEIVPGSVVDDEAKRVERLKRLKANGGIAEGFQEEEDDEKKGSDVEDSDDSDSDSDSDYSAADLDKRTKEEEELEDENNMLDNDWDTSEWTMQEIESACSTLITECETKASKKRQELSIRMLIRLLDRHQEAVSYVNKVSESILNKAFPGILVDGIHPHALNLSHLLAAIAPRFADSFSMLGPIAKVCKILTYEMDLAARVLQWRHKLRKQRRALFLSKGSIPKERYIRKQLTLNMKTDDLNKKWRSMHSAENPSALPPDVQLSYMRFLLALCTPENTKYASGNRKEVVKKNGLIPICLCLKECDEGLPDLEGGPSLASGSTANVSLAALQLDDHGISMAHQVSCLLMLQIAKERSLLFSILRARIHEGLEKILSLYQRLPAEDICMALDVLDQMGMNALKCSDVNLSEEDYKVYDQNRRARLFHEEDAVDDDASACPSDIEDEGEKQYWRRSTRGAIRDLLVKPILIQHLTALLHVPHEQIFLGSVMILHKLACTQGFNHVLIEIIALAGRALEKVVEGINMQDSMIPFACLALIKQLATRQEGRDGMITSKVVGMLMPLISGKQATSSKIFIMALAAFVSLAQDQTSDNAPFELDVVPPKHELYNDLMALLTREGSSPGISIEHLLDMKVLPFVLNFLVRPENPALFFNLSNHHKQMGAVILHRISLHKEACKMLCMDAVVEYFSYCIQVNFTQLLENHFGHSETDMLLFFSSTQSACRGLAQIANVVDGGEIKVLDCINTQNIFKEIEELLSFPNVGLDSTYRPRLECSDAASSLVASVARVPISELHAESDIESKITMKEDVDSCIKTLKRLAEQMAKPLMSIVHGCPNRDAVANASIALAKLSSTNETCDILLDMGAAKIAASLFPDKPAILEGARNIKDEIYDVSLKEKRDSEIEDLVGLDASAFMLAASLCRTPKGKRAIQTSGILKRCVERFHLSSGKKGVDLVIRGEIACVFAKLANTQTQESGNTGNANDYILNPNYNTLPMLVELLREGGRYYRRARYWAASAIAELCSDTIRVVPMVVKMGAVQAFGKVVKDYVRKEGPAPLPLLRPVLFGLKRIAAYPLGTFVFALVEDGLQQPLLSIGSNVALQLEYVHLKDRETLGDIARDILFMLQDGLASAPGGAAGMVAALGEVDDFPLQGGGNGEHEISVSESRKEDRAEDGGAEEGEEERVFDGTYSSMGVSTVGSLAANLEDEEVTHETRLSRMDAEDPKFRNELRRRKEHYEMGASYRLSRDGTKREGVVPGSSASGPGPAVKKDRNSKKGSKVIKKIEDVKQQRRVVNEYSFEGYGDAPISRGISRSESTPTMATTRGHLDLSSTSPVKPAIVEINTVPLLAHTRPPGASPKAAHIPKGGMGFGSPTGRGFQGVLPSPLLVAVTEVDPGTGGAGTGGAGSRAGTGTGSGKKQLVTFTRPKKKTDKGLFIDPTFVDNQPVTEQTIDNLGNREGKPRLLSAKSLTDNRPFEDLETYSHQVEIMGTKIKVEGKRVAGPKSILDDDGRPQSAVTFENVHESTVRRELARLRSAV